MKKIKRYIFLRDAFMISLTSFGGAQAHLTLFLKIFVEKRRYLSEEELMELYALCQILPGPTSTQTITALGFKIGGGILAYITLIIWILPAVSCMTLFGVVVAHFENKGISLDFTRFIQPMAIGFVAYAAISISRKLIKSNLSSALMITSAFTAFIYPAPWIIPALLIAGGIIAAFKYKKQPEFQSKKIRIKWFNFFVFALFFIGIGILSETTRFLPFRLMENFYRTGSIIFGGGQVLVPMLYTEFVQTKALLSGEEFLSGYAFVQTVPGPTFSFVSYIGALSMRSFGISGSILGGAIASVCIFLPGTLMIFFVIRFWDDLKKYRVVRASLEGINAAGTGLILAAALLLYQTVETNLLHIALILGTFCILNFTKIPAPLLIISGLLVGAIL